MCGIAGRFSSSLLAPDPLWADRADRLLAHRGPDGSGRYRDPYCELVHRRLAIVDLSEAGQQPMSNEDGSILVIYNGEIYNHRELRRDLETRGHRFRSASDTEVLVHLYEEVGAGLVDALRGMFAFAIYDRRRCCVLLARDRFGIKPLYYAQLREGWIFGSEIKALMAAEGIQVVIDRQACYDYLGLGYVPEPATGFRNVFALPKGTTLLIDSSGARAGRFGALQVRCVSSLRLVRVVDAVGDALTRAVRSQSIADVPVAALLSGGLDSSLVVAAYCRSLKDSQPLTFNVRFPDREYDETHVARAVADRYGTRHRTVDLGDQELNPETVVALLDHFDQPFADTSLIPTYWVARAIHDQGIKCTVSGDGGDEAFGGYARFWRANTLLRLMSLPRSVRRVVGLGGRGLVGFTRDLGRQVAKAVRLADSGIQSAASLVAGLSNYLSDEEKRSLLAPDALDGLKPASRLFEGGVPGGVSDLEGLSRHLTENLFELSLPSDMLRKVDMMSMRSSVEVRVPMLDEDVVGLGLSLCHSLKTDGRHGKLVLRALARNWLPQAVAEHPKHGFSIPLDVMAGSNFHDMVADHLLASGARIRSLIDARRIQAWLSSFREAGRSRRDGRLSREGLYQRVFIVLALELWMRRAGLSW